MDNLQARIAGIGSISKSKAGYYNEYDEFYVKHPFAIVGRFAGTVWPCVFPYCVLNCVILTILTLVQYFFGITISILPQGHALMSILIAYLGVSKVTLAYNRYMDAQISTGHAFITLRELHQMSLTLTEKCVGSKADEWRADTKRLIEQVIRESVATLRNGAHSAMLVRNVRTNFSGSKVFVGKGGSDDPMVLMHILRSHMYHESLALKKEGSPDGFTELQLLERCKMTDLLHEFTVSYRNLLRLSSTPMPFALVQMGRTFTFVWVITIPFILTGHDFYKDYASGFSYCVLLTYGFLGLEFVSRMLSNPFGDEMSGDFDVAGMGAAAIIGIEHDSKQWDNNLQKLLLNRRDSFESIRSKRKVSASTKAAKKAAEAVDDNATPYNAMSAGGDLEYAHAPVQTTSMDAHSFT
ncbi:hypothetical protein ACHAWF_005831 [Thalassiosira exigua]